MAQFDVYRNPSESADRIPYLLDTQSDLLSRSTTRIVVPLVRATEFSRVMMRLNPSFEVEGIAVTMLTLELAGVPRSRLGSPIASLATHRDAIRDAIDFAFQGF
jgi:toxin CcdB